jgi:predicted ATPase
MTHNSQTPDVEGDRLFVVSGCSGSGKSALIAELAKRGELVVSEPGRQIVKQQLEDGGSSLPWENVRPSLTSALDERFRIFRITRILAVASSSIVASSMSYQPWSG